LARTFKSSTNFEILFHDALPDLDCLTTKLGTSVAPVDLKSLMTILHLLEKSAGSIIDYSISSA
jgi:hypothetical protein